MGVATGKTGVGPAIRELAGGSRAATDAAQQLEFGDKQLAIKALADLTTKASHVLTSSPQAHADPGTADMRQLAESLRNQDALASNGIVMTVGRKLLPHISLFGIGLFLFAAGKSVGAGAFALLAVGSTAVFVGALRLAAQAGPAAMKALGDLFNEPAEVKRLLRDHVDGPESQLYSQIGRSRPFRPVTLLGPIGGAIVVIAAGLIIAGAVTGFSNASQEYVEQNTPDLTLPETTEPSYPTYP